MIDFFLSTVTLFKITDLVPLISLVDANLLTSQAALTTTIVDFVAGMLILFSFLDQGTNCSIIIVFSFCSREARKEMFLCSITQKFNLTYSTKR